MAARLVMWNRKFPLLKASLRRGRGLALAACAIGFVAVGPAAAAPGKFFNAIHCDPQYASEADWVSLVALVQAADDRDLTLTIQFNPTWGPVIAAGAGRAGKIALWVASGHEVGGHHHVLDHPGGWDGYSNEEGANEDLAYLGDMQQWLADLEAILPTGASVITVSSKNFDFPDGIDFQTGGSFSTPSSDDADSVPTLYNILGNPVWNLNHGALIAGGTWYTDDMMDAFDATTSDQVFGAAFHPHDYYPGNRTEVDRWLDFLAAAEGSEGSTAGAILQAHVDSLAGVPSGAGAGLIGALLAGGALALGRTAFLRRRTR